MDGAISAHILHFSARVLVKQAAMTTTLRSTIIGQPPNLNEPYLSVERLMDFLTALGQDVEISVKPAR
jgi:hypothetical protein